MESIAVVAPRPISFWRDILCPKEHGSWSLAFEPIALGLLVAPSVAGALLAVALSAVFFARRPLRLTVLERRPERCGSAGKALALCASVAVAAFAGAIAVAGVNWFGWLLPAAIAGGVFAFFDARGEGREEFAELAGAAAFALTPMAFAAVAGLPTADAAALGVLMTARAVPSVATVRAFLRAAKTGVRRDSLALLATGAALVVAGYLVMRGVAPWFTLAAMLIFAARTVVLLVLIRPGWRARTLGMLETFLGLGFVLGLAATWSA